MSEATKTGVPEPRETVLLTALQLTAGVRNELYGDPVENHERIARIFEAMTGVSLTAQQVALLHVATKLSRIRTTASHFDSYVDAAAYIAIARECEMRQPAPD